MGSLSFVIKLWEKTTYFLQNSALKAYWKHHFRFDGVDCLAIEQYNKKSHKKLMFKHTEMLCESVTITRLPIYFIVFSWILRKLKNRFLSCLTERIVSAGLSLGLGISKTNMLSILFLYRVCFELCLHKIYAIDFFNRESRLAH